MDSSKTHPQFKRKKHKHGLNHHRHVVYIVLLALCSASVILLSNSFLDTSTQIQTQSSTLVFERLDFLDGFLENQPTEVLQQRPSQETLQPAKYPSKSFIIKPTQNITQQDLKSPKLRNDHGKQKTTPPPIFPAPIKLPFPIFVASLFKSGTTTIHAYFQCGGQRSVHWKNDKGERTGKCLYDNFRDGTDPFAGCGDYDIWTDNSFILAPSICWDPSVTSLNAIYQAYPNATILLTVREAFSWTNSVIRWGNLFKWLTSCHELWPEQPQKPQLDVEDIRQFYLWQIQHVRDFAAAHPSMTFLEVSLEDNATASILEERIGIPASCWATHNKNDKSKLTKAKQDALKELEHIK